MSCLRDDRSRDSGKPTPDHLPVRRSPQRLRRSLAVLVVAVAVPATFATSPAAAKFAPLSDANCQYNGVTYPEGAILRDEEPGSGYRECKQGGWHIYGPA